MYPPVHVADIARHEGKEITLHGWLHNRRSSAKLHFLQLRDGTGTIQCVVFKGNVSPEVFVEADHLPQETSLSVTGADWIEWIWYQPFTSGTYACNVAVNGSLVASVPFTVGP